MDVKDRYVATSRGRTWCKENGSGLRWKNLNIEINKDDASANTVLNMMLIQKLTLKPMFRALRCNITQVGLFTSDNYLAELSSWSSSYLMPWVSVSKKKILFQKKKQKKDRPCPNSNSAFLMTLRLLLEMWTKWFQQTMHFLSCLVDPGLKGVSGYSSRCWGALVKLIALGWTRSDELLHDLQAFNLWILSGDLNVAQSRLSWVVLHRTLQRYMNREEQLILGYGCKRTY